MDHARLLLLVASGIVLHSATSVLAKSTFISSQIDGRGVEIVSCDLDGDHLKELVLIDGTDLRIFHQDPTRGFSRDLEQRCHLEDGASAVWPARLGRNSDSLLLLRHDGVTELSFTNRTSPPVSRQIIHQPTILPKRMEGSVVRFFPLCARTDTDWPLLLVPVPGGVQVWDHREDWRPTQLLDGILQARILPLGLSNPGYSRAVEFSVSPGDLNGDRRDDLIIRRRGSAEAFVIYLQQSDRTFAPVLTYTNLIDTGSWISWVDLNRDGKVDLIKNTWVDEPSFIPTIPSAKVLVRTYLADERGRLPAEPQAIFRKNDWNPAVPIVDIDGDGYVDLALGYSHLDKDAFRKQVTTKQLEFSLKVSFYRPGAGFPNESDCQRELSIRTDGPGMVFGWRQSEYFEYLINLTGDFNGDGKKDLLVKDERDHISAFFFISRERGFSPQADLKFDCPEAIAMMEPRDLNGDGIDDLIITLDDAKGFRILTSAGK